MVCSLENLPGLVQKTRTEEGRKEILSNETHSMHKLSLSLKHFGPQPDVETEGDFETAPYCSPIASLLPIT